MTARLDWNVVVTAHEGMDLDLVRALAPLVRLRRSGYRNVLIGLVEDVDAFLAAVASLQEQQASLRQWLARIVPVERTFRVDVSTLDETLERETSGFVDRLGGRRFYVRVERRGHKGRIHTHATEQTLGAALVAALEARGATPSVGFTDPDEIVVVELVGEAGGVGLVSRDRRRFAFVRVA